MRVRRSGVGTRGDDLHDRTTTGVLTAAPRPGSIAAREAFGRVR